ncbi:MAG: hypothetical protein OXR67_07605 [Chloroflexota bacterium]|nr:hypothetical protein [Chloroflexota bacterium]
MFSRQSSPAHVDDTSEIDGQMGLGIMAVEQGKALSEYWKSQNAPAGNVTYTFPGDPETESYPRCHFDYKGFAVNNPFAESLTHHKFLRTRIGSETLSQSQQACAFNVGSWHPWFVGSPLGFTRNVAVGFVNANDSMVVNRRDLTELNKKVTELTDQVRALEELVAESHKVILAFSQSYYWTPEWQAKEQRADEDERLGRFKQYDDVEEFIREMNG